MGTQDARRRLAAILAADAAGYSRLISADEEGTVAALNAARRLFTQHVEAHRGRVVDTAGDSVLAVFPSVVEAARAAVAVQEELARRSEPLPVDRRLLFRVGVHLGDIIEHADGTVYGDGVNIAARLQALAEAGGITVSEDAHRQIEGKLDLHVEFAGEQQVKNIPKPVRVYRVRGDRPRPAGRRRARYRTALYGAVGVLIALGAAVAARQLARPTTPGTGETASRPEQAALALPRGPAIAVLPFTNLSDDRDQEYFAEGITEDIITELSRFRELFVVARNSTFRYKGQAVDVRKVGRELGVRYVLEGSVRRAGDQVRVTAQLVDSSTGTHLWGETYDRSLRATDLFAIQDEIRERVVGVIADDFGVITRAAMATARHAPPETLGAYECVLRARAFREVHTEALHRRALDCVDRAVEVDPNYAEAWAWRAYIYSEAWVHDWNLPEQGADAALARAWDYAQRGVELDPTSQMAHQQRAYMHYYRGDYDAFRAEAERAIALNPNSAVTLAGLGSFMRLAGAPDRGVALVRKAIALNPNHPGWYHFALAGYHYDRREYEQALAEAQKINLPGFWATHAVLAQVYAQLGRTAEARAAAAKLLELNPGFPARAGRELRKFFYSDAKMGHALDGLRKAGLEIPRAATPAAR